VWGVVALLSRFAIPLFAGFTFVNLISGGGDAFESLDTLILLLQIFFVLSILNGIVLGVGCWQVGSVMKTLKRATGEKKVGSGSLSIQIGGILNGVITTLLLAPFAWVLITGKGFTLEYVNESFLIATAIGKICCVPSFMILGFGSVGGALSAFKKTRQGGGGQRPSGPGYDDANVDRPQMP